MAWGMAIAISSAEGLSGIQKAPPVTPIPAGLTEPSSSQGGCTCDSPKAPGWRAGGGKKQQRPPGGSGGSGAGRGEPPGDAVHDESSMTKGVVGVPKGVVGVPSPAKASELDLRCGVPGDDAAVVGVLSPVCGGDLLAPPSQCRFL